GIPSGAVSIPTRNVHTRSETALLSDIQATVGLLVAVLSNAIERP
ncbi:MAG: M42 family peptidase, partial [Chloroflexi bacterium]|nr:M42 family peptidase [Chloroflexota bacterium]